MTKQAQNFLKSIEKDHKPTALFAVAQLVMDVAAELAREVIRLNAIIKEQTSYAHNNKSQS